MSLTRCNHLANIARRHQMVFNISMAEYRISKEDQELTNRYMQAILIAQFQESAKTLAY